MNVEGRGYTVRGTVWVSQHVQPPSESNEMI